MKSAVKHSTVCSVKLWLSEPCRAPAVGDLDVWCRLDSCFLSLMESDYSSWQVRPVSLISAAFMCLKLWNTTLNTKSLSPFTFCHMRTWAGLWTLLVTADKIPHTPHSGWSESQENRSELYASHWLNVSACIFLRVHYYCATILQGHCCCTLGLAPLKTTVIGLKKYKQARVFFPLQNDDRLNQTVLQSRSLVWRGVRLSETTWGQTNVGVCRQTAVIGCNQLL